MDAHRKLTDELRRLIESVQLAEVTDDAAAALSERIARMIEELPNDGRRSWHAHMDPDDNFRSTGKGYDDLSSLNDLRDPIVGTLNPVAPPLAIEVIQTDSGPRLRGDVTLSAAYEGAPRTVHGGIVSALMDEMLGMAQRVLPVAGYTGTLTVVFRAPTPTYAPLVAEAWMDRIEGRKIFMLGTLRARDVLCAEAEGVYISPRAASGGAEN